MLEGVGAGRALHNVERVRSSRDKAGTTAESIGQESEKELEAC